MTQMAEERFCQNELWGSKGGSIVEYHYHQGVPYLVWKLIEFIEFLLKFDQGFHMNVIYLQTKIPLKYLFGTSFDLK